MEHSYNPQLLTLYFAGGKLVEKSKEANVLVTNQIKRSVKLLNAISQGIPIVSPRWLDVCKHSKNFVG